MLDFLKAIVYGVIEGITEWLPISSTGHLIILEEVMPMNVSREYYDMFNVVIQLGAILAVVVLYFHKLNPFSSRKSPKQKMLTWSLWLKVCIAVMPSVVLGLLYELLVDEDAIPNTVEIAVIATMLIVYGVAFMWVEHRNRGVEPKIKTVGALDIKTAILIGCFQCLALIPGTSRSGATIFGAVLLGVGRGAAGEFSFFLAIPTMVGASMLKIVKYIWEMLEQASAAKALPPEQANQIVGQMMGLKELGLLLTGCVVAFLVSLVVIRGLMEYVRKNSFAIFGAYRLGLGALLFLYLLVLVVF